MKMLAEQVLRAGRPDQEDSSVEAIYTFSGCESRDYLLSTIFKTVAPTVLQVPVRENRTIKVHLRCPSNEKEQNKESI